jgi:hypothetical protein
MCPFIRPAGNSRIAEERWQSGRMRIIANDVTPEMGSEGSNPSLSVPRARRICGLFSFLAAFLPPFRESGRCVAAPGTNNPTEVSLKLHQDSILG